MSTSTPAVPGLIDEPLSTFGSFYVERWEKGEHADRRIRKLRKVLVVNTESKIVIRRVSAELGADRFSISAVEVTYSDPNNVAPKLDLAGPVAEPEQPAGPPLPVMPKLASRVRARMAA